MINFAKTFDMATETGYIADVRYLKNFIKIRCVKE